MDSKQLEELLQKYWDCETSLEEEERLREYFRTHDVPENFKEATVLFSYFDRQRQKAVGPQFEDKVVKKLKSPAGKSIKIDFRQTGVWQTSLRIAAGVAVLIAAVYFVAYEIHTKNTDDVAMEDTFDSPEKALEETKKALLMISKGFGKAEQQAKKINVLNEAQDKVKNNTKEL